MITEITKRSPC